MRVKDIESMLDNATLECQEEMRFLLDKLEIAINALEQVSEEMSIVRTMTISEQALKAIRE